MRHLVRALVPATGRYAVQGAQVRAGLELWASRAGTRLASRTTEPARARRAPPTQSSSSADASSCSGRTAVTRRGRSPRPGRARSSWNGWRGRGRRPCLPGRGLSAVTGQPLPGRARSGGRRAPASRHDRPRDRDRRCFARQGSSGPIQVGLGILVVFLSGPPASRRRRRRGGRDPACGPVGAEVVLFRALAGTRIPADLAPPSPALLGGYREGLLAPVQWHPGDPHVAGALAKLSGADRRRPRERARRAHDVAAQAYVVIARLPPPSPGGPTRRGPATPHNNNLLRRLRADPRPGVQRGHSLSVVRWSRARRELPRPPSQPNVRRAWIATGRRRWPTRACGTWRSRRRWCPPRWRTRRTYPSPNCEAQCEQREGRASVPAGWVHNTMSQATRRKKKKTNC